MHIRTHLYITVTLFTNVSFSGLITLVVNSFQLKDLHSNNVDVWTFTYVSELGRNLVIEVGFLSP